MATNLGVPAFAIFMPALLISKDVRETIFGEMGVKCDPVCIPARLSADAGYRREFRVRADGLQTTAGVASVDQESACSINGVLVLVYVTGTLKGLVERRNPERIPFKQFTPLSWSDVPDCDETDVLMFTAEGDYHPTLHCPILQTYLDTVLKGCLEYGEDFAAEFLDTTFGWNTFWMNEREVSRRPWIHCPQYKVIDKLLTEYPCDENRNYMRHRLLESEFSKHYLQPPNVRFDEEMEGKWAHELRGKYTEKLAKKPDNFIFGFGSLINTPSRRSSLPEASDALPVRVSEALGFRREWNFQSPTASLTALGVRKINMDCPCQKKPKEERHPDCVPSSINGVIYPVAGEMSAFDEREEGYERILIPWDLITTLSTIGISALDVQVWMYVPKGDNGEPGIGLHLASFDYPVLQTYLDVCLEGCFEYGEGFAKEFLNSTFGWNKFWLNDRKIPRRPWINCPGYRKIDALLEEEVKTAVRKLPVEYSFFSLADDVISGTEETAEVMFKRDKSLSSSKQNAQKTESEDKEEDKRTQEEKEEDKATEEEEKEDMVSDLCGDEQKKCSISMMLKKTKEKMRSPMLRKKLAKSQSTLDLMY